MRGDLRTGLVLLSQWTPAAWHLRPLHGPAGDDFSSANLTDFALSADGSDLEAGKKAIANTLYECFRCERLVETQQYQGRTIVPRFCPWCGKPVSSIIGRELDGYRIDEVISRGGFGLIYLASNLAQPKMKLALKILRPEMGYLRPELVRIFVEEARLTEEIGQTCWNVVRIFNVREKPWPYYFMEYLRGETLDKILEKQGAKKIAMEDCKGFLRGFAKALVATHKHGRVHRDLKPMNIMVLQSGEFSRPEERIASAAELVDCLKDPVPLWVWLASSAAAALFLVLTAVAFLRQAAPLTLKLKWQGEKTASDPYVLWVQDENDLANRKITGFIGEEGKEISSCTPTPNNGLVKCYVEGGKDVKVIFEGPRLATLLDKTILISDKGKGFYFERKISIQQDKIKPQVANARFSSKKDDETLLSGSGPFNPNSVWLIAEVTEANFKEAILTGNPDFTHDQLKPSIKEPALR